MNNSNLLNQFIEKAQKLESISFQETMAVITQNYDYHPTEFTNGLQDKQLTNKSGSNEGSCKIFALAQIHKLSEDQTLNLFGDYYQQDVLKHPDGTDHQNIRNFIEFGWSGIEFSGQALKEKA